MPRLTWILVLSLCLSGVAPAGAKEVPLPPAKPECRLLRILHAPGKYLRRERALHALAKAIHANPRLEDSFRKHCEAVGGMAIWDTKRALKDAGFWLLLGQAVNIGGFFQPDLLLTYLAAGIAVDVSAFSYRMLGMSRARRQVVNEMIRDQSLPRRLVDPYREALGLPPAPKRVRKKDRVPSTNAPTAAAEQAQPGGPGDLAGAGAGI